MQLSFESVSFTFTVTESNDHMKGSALEDVGEKLEKDPDPSVAHHGLTSRVFLHTLMFFSHNNRIVLLSKFTIVKFKAMVVILREWSISNTVSTKSPGSSAGIQKETNLEGTDVFKPGMHNVSL